MQVVVVGIAGTYELSIEREKEREKLYLFFCGWKGKKKGTGVRCCRAGVGAGLAPLNSPRNLFLSTPGQIHRFRHNLARRIEATATEDPHPLIIDVFLS